MTTKEKILDDLKTVMASCLEGFDSSWDCSTEEGRDGFMDMHKLLEKVQKYIEKN